MTDSAVTAVVASRDAQWRAEVRQRLSTFPVIVIAEWDTTGASPPCGIRFQDNRLDSVDEPSIVVRIGIAQDRPYDITWPWDDAAIWAVIEKARIQLSSRGLLTDPEFLSSAFHRLIELSADSIEIVDANVRLLYVNPAFENITGYTIPEVLGRTTADLFRAGTHDPAFYREIMQTLRGGNVWRGQLVARRADKELSYQESVLAPVTGPRGETLGFVALKRDLERDNLLMRAVQSQDAQRAALFQEVADAFLLHDEAGRLLDRNSRAERMFNLERRGDQPASTILDCVSPQDRSKLENGWAQLKKEDSVEIDAVLQTLPYEDERIVSFRSVRVVVAGEDLILSIARDITIRVAMEKQARELSEAQRRIQGLTETLHEERQQEKQARLASLAVLAGSLAHDLNNALSVIMGNLDFLHDADDPEERREVLGDIEHGIKSAQDITRRFTSFSRGSAVVLSPLHVQPWLHEIVRAFRSGQRANAMLDMAEQPIWCAADEPQLTQVVLNLLMNAFQAAGPESQITLTLDTVSPKPGSTFACISVKDEGPGIPPDLLARIFEPFVTSKPGGSGLGLASANRIVKEHGGTLRASNRAPQGARFDITIPCIKRSEQKPRKLLEVQTPSTARVSLSGIHVMVLDDELSVLHLIGRLLEARGASTELFATGEALLQRVTERRSDEVFFRSTVFLLDLLIESGMDGVETLRRLKAIHPGVKAVACSGHPPDPTITDYGTVGFTVYIKKPFAPDKLIEAVRRTADEPRPAT